MKKLIILIIIASLTAWATFYKKDKLLNVLKQKEVQTWAISKTKSGTIETTTQKFEEKIEKKEEKLQTKEQISKEIVKEKIERLRKKYALKSAIKVWQEYLDNKEYVSALPKFLSILKQIPNDENTIQQIGQIYFGLKKFQNAYRYYERIKEYKHLDTSLAINSLIFSKIDIYTEKNIEDIKEEIMSFPLTKDEEFYHINSVWCLSDFDTCKANFISYFEQRENEKTQTWNTDNKEKPEIIFEELKSIQQALINYKNFKLDDSWYQDALITWTFFSNGSYPIAISAWKKILEERQDYKPIIKIVAKSYFELWEYPQSKEYLLKYKNFDNTDPEISYLLWVIYSKLHDYVLSSVHLKKSIEIGYKDSIDARRRIIYNYNKVWETDKMLGAFKDMVKDDESISISDIDLALYHHITNGKIPEAKEIVQFAIKKYTTENSKWEEIVEYWDTLYSYLWWIQLEEKEVEWNVEVAEKNLKKARLLNPENPMNSLIIGKLQVEKWKTKLALSYFKKTLSLWTVEEFSKLAREEIEKLESKD